MRARFILRQDILFLSLCFRILSNPSVTSLSTKPRDNASLQTRSISFDAHKPDLVRPTSHGYRKLVKRTFEDDPLGSVGGDPKQPCKKKSGHGSSKKIHQDTPPQGLGAILYTDFSGTDILPSPSDDSTADESLKSPGSTQKSTSSLHKDKNKCGKKNRKKKKYPEDVEGEYFLPPSFDGGSSPPDDYRPSPMPPQHWKEQGRYPDSAQVVTIKVVTENGCNVCSKEGKKELVSPGNTAKKPESALPSPTKDLGKPITNSTSESKGLPIISSGNGSELPKSDCKNTTGSTPSMKSPISSPKNTTSKPEATLPSPTKDLGKPITNSTSKSNGLPTISSGDGSEMPKSNCKNKTSSTPSMTSPVSSPENTTSKSNSTIPSITKDLGKPITNSTSKSSSLPTISPDQLPKSNSTNTTSSTPSIKSPIPGPPASSPNYNSSPSEIPKSNSTGITPQKSVPSVKSPTSNPSNPPSTPLKSLPTPDSRSSDGNSHIEQLGFKTTAIWLVFWFLLL